MTEDLAEQKHLDLQEFVDSGLLQEVNRQFFHPLGLALAVEKDHGRVTRLAYIHDGRDDEEGFVFEDFGPADVERGRAVVVEQERRQAIRRERLGFGVQELPT